MSNNFMGLDGFVWFTGVVEDRNDPALLGRVRVRCLGFHTEDKVKIPTSSLPWAHIMLPITTPSMNGKGQSIPFMVEGTWVIGFFRDAELQQQPVIIGTLPGYPQTISDKTKGFNDPNGVYPLSTHLNESDVNRLAKGGADDKPHEIIELKESKRDKQVAVASGEPWDEPAGSHSSSKYPYNHVFESEVGHIKEYDDTPSNERIHEYHKTGTFYEMRPDGSKITRVVGNNYEVVHGSDYVHVKGSANLTVDDTLNIKAKTINMVADTMNKTIGTLTETITTHNETTGTLTETYTTKTETATTGNTTYTSGDVVASNISLVGHQHVDNAGLAAGVTTVPIGGSGSVTSAQGDTVTAISSGITATEPTSLDLTTVSNVTLPTATSSYPDTLVKTDSTGTVNSTILADNAVTQDKLADDAVGSAEMKTLSTLLIKNSGGTTLKTVHGAGE